MEDLLGGLAEQIPVTAQGLAHSEDSNRAPAMLFHRHINEHTS
jgi:hypothetical protein